MSYLNKAADIYWTSEPRAQVRRRKPVAARRKPEERVERTAPWWLSMLIVASIFVMVCVSVNFRAAAEVTGEVEQNTKLSSEVQNLLDENLALQEEIHTLKTDPRIIEQEAKRIGLDLQPR